MKSMFTHLEGKSASEVLKMTEERKAKVREYAPAAAGVAVGGTLAGLAIAKAVTATHVVPMAAGTTAAGTNVIAFQTVQASLISKVIMGAIGVGLSIVAGAFVYGAVKSALNPEDKSEKETN